MDANFEQARTFFLEGVAHYQAGRLPLAEQKFLAAQSLVPGRPSVLTNLGAVRLRLGRPGEALPVLQEAVEKEPGNAEALGHLGTALAELGRPEQALPLFDRALQADARFGAVWMMRGTALKELGRLEEAAASYREALARGGDRELLEYYLAGLQDARTPQRAPRHYVEALFDGYAAGFDQHLVQALRYDAPGVLVRRLSEGGRRFLHALDLGCGTGLCGPLLRPLSQRLTGVDLSANMLERAGALGAYDALVQGDVVEFLAEGADGFDAVVAADVFVYVGALDEVFRRLAQRMPPQGLFAFTVEAAQEAEVELRTSLRYAHSEAGLRRLAQQHGFRVDAIERRPVREEQRQPIPGLFCWFEKT